MIVGSPVLSRPSETCAPPIDTNRATRAHLIRNTTGAPAVVTIRGNWATDGYLHVYDTPVDLSTPLINCRAGNDDRPLQDFEQDTLSSEVARVVIAAGDEVAVVVTAYLENTLIGPYTLEVTHHSGEEGEVDAIPVSVAGQTVHTEIYVGQQDESFAFPEKDCNLTSPITLAYQPIFFENTSPQAFNFDFTAAMVGGGGTTARVYFSILPSGAVEMPVDDYSCQNPTPFEAVPGGSVTFTDFILAGERVMVTVSPATFGESGHIVVDAVFSAQ